MKRKITGIFSLLIFASYALEAQTAIVSGHVTSADGKPLGGVSIVIQGSKTAVLSGADGSFSISASVGQTAKFTFIGYEDKEVTIGSGQTLNIVLNEKGQELQSVVVTALGIKRSERSLAYAQQQVSGSEVTKSKTDNFINSLSGKVAGLTITPSSSGVGGSSKVILRGVRSATGSSQPLYVIDGIPISNSSNANGQPTGSVFGGGTDGGDGISNLNPDDIESMSVLEGASAAALYGYEGQNGVILITTKKGKAGKPEINFNSSEMISKAMSLPKFQNRYGQSAEGDKLSWDTVATLSGTQDNLKQFFRTGSNYTNSVNLTTGGENAQTYFSYANTTAHGIEPTNNLSRHNVTLRETAKFFNNKLTVDGSASYITQKIHNSPAVGLYFNPLVGLYLFPRGLDITTYKTHYLNPDSVGFARQNWVADEDIQQNPWWILNKNPDFLTRNRFIFNGSIRYEANNWLTLQARGSVDRITDDFEQDIYSGTQSTLNPQGNGSLGLSNQTVDQKYADFLATIKIPLQSKFKIDAILGTSIKDVKTTGEKIGRGSGSLFPNSPAFTDQGLSIPDLFTPSNIIAAQAGASSNTTAPVSEIAGRNQTQSIFGNLNISYNEWIFLSLTERNDWSSLLAFTPKKSFSYPSAGLSLVISQLAKMPESINLLKVRGSYAEVGNPPSIPYIANILNYESAAGQLVFNNAQVIGTLKPENTKSSEFGLDMRLINRLDIGFTYYNTKTVNQLFQVSPSVASLISTAFVNAGEIKNTGEELTIAYNVFGQKPFSWNTNITASHNTNKVVKVDPDHDIDSYSLSASGGNAYESRLVKGGSAGDIYGYGFVRDDQGRIEISADGKPLYNTSEMKYLGNPNPKYQLGWNNNFAYKNFDFSFLIDGKFGGKVMSMTQGIMDYYGVSKVTGDARDAGMVKVNGVDPDQNPVTSVKPIDWYQTIGGRGGVSEAYMYSATTVRLREFSLGYTWPIKSNVIKSLKLALTGRNLFFFYKKAPYDPEITMSTGIQYSGIDVFSQPVTRNFGLSLNAKF